MLQLHVLGEKLMENYSANLPHGYYMLIAEGKIYLTLTPIASDQTQHHKQCLLIGSNMKYTTSLSSYSCPKIFNLK